MRYCRSSTLQFALEGTGQALGSFVAPFLLLLLVFGPEVDAFCVALRLPSLKQARPHEVR